MNILYALVAFAVVMVVMTTLVVAVLELINGLRSTRERYLRYMIGSVFDEYLWPQYGELLDPIEVVVTKPIKPLRGDDEEGIPEKVPIPKGWMVWLVRFLDVPRNWDAFLTSRGDITHKSRWGSSTWRSRPQPYWVFLGILAWIAIILFGLAQLHFIVFLSVVVMIVFLIDRSREREREALPLIEELNDAKVARLHEVNYLMTCLTKANSEAEDSEESVESLRLTLLNLFAKYPEIADLYGRVYYRRRFVDEVARLSRGMSAGGAGMKDRSQAKIGVLEFAEYLGSTHFGAAIRDVAIARNQNEADETPDGAIKDQVREMARRYDALSRQATENYRRMTRRASVVLAFVIALATNFDAFHIFAAFTRDSDLAQSVEQAYAARLEEMSRQESALVDRITDLSRQEPIDDAELKQEPEPGDDAGNQTGVAGASEAIKATQVELEKLRSTMDATVGELSGLGVPIGAQQFPFCGFGDEVIVQVNEEKPVFEHLDPRCQATSLAMYAKTEMKSAQNAETQTEPAETTEEAGKITECLLAEKTDKRMVLKLSYSSLLACHGYSLGLDRTDNDASLDTSWWKDQGDQLKDLFAHWIRNLSAQWWAASDWLVMRWDHGMAEWLAGVLAAGALIGLGGPFWFDLYARLSSVVRITRTFGLEPKAKPTASDNDIPSPESQHNPKSVEDAFELSLKATTKVEDYKTELRSFALRAAMTEKQPEDDTIATPRRHHDANGAPID